MVIVWLVVSGVGCLACVLAAGNSSVVAPLRVCVGGGDRLVLVEDGRWW